MSKDFRSLMPIGARRADSVTQLQEIIFESLAIEYPPYVDWCTKVGFDPQKTTVGQLVAHAEVMLSLAGNATAQANLKNRLEGKLADKVEQVNPLAELTDEQLTKLENGVKEIEGGDK